MGPPFSSRRKGCAGLQFPQVSDWPNFICEACTVRQVLHRELTGPGDRRLLMLERMRLIDMAWSWSAGTHQSYQSKLRQIRAFEDSHAITILQSTPLSEPPSSPDIPLMWCIEASSTRLTRHKSRGYEPTPISFTTVRQLRSAASQFWAWDFLVTHPSASMLTREQRLVNQVCRPSDSYAFSLVSNGLSTRMGTEAKPSLALLERHVKCLDTELDHQFQFPMNPSQRRAAALAGFSNSIFWLGWLRTSETFGLTFDDIDYVPAPRAAERDLPANVSMLNFSLLEETKSDRTKKVDVCCAGTTKGGFSLETWYLRVLETCGDRPVSRPIFVKEDGTPWTSLYFREQFLYPSLRRLQAKGDPYLAMLDETGPNSLEARIWSLHCYRRGARTHVSRSQPGRRTMASKDQIYEHARWRYRRNSQPVDVIYRDWTFFDHIKITLFYM